MLLISAFGRSAAVDQRGATITSVVDDDGAELLARGNKAKPDLIARGDLVGTGLTGWIDCFPSIAPDTIDLAGHEIALTGHGELWRREWTVDKVGASFAELTCEIPELGVHYSKHIELNSSGLSVRSRVSNVGGGPLDYVWASHPLLAVSESAWIELPDAPVTEWPRRSRESRLDAVWPAEDDRREWSTLSPGRAVKLFFPWPEDGVRFSADGVRVRRMTFAATHGPRPYLGLWINRGGYPDGQPLSHFAIEPTIGSADSVNLSTAERTTGRLAEGTTHVFEVSITDEARLRKPG